MENSDTLGKGINKKIDRLAESFYRSFNMPISIVRPFNTYGSRSHFEGPYGEVIPRFVIRALNNLPPIIFGDGTQTRDFTYVDDTVDGIFKVSQSDKLVGDIINIAYGKERSINEVARIVLKTLGKANLKIIYQKSRPGDVKRHFADIKKAKKILHFNPKIYLEEGIVQYVEWLKKEKINTKQELKKIEERNW